jgi:hypothetical protein
MYTYTDMGCPGFELIPTVAGGMRGWLPGGRYAVPATKASVMWSLKNTFAAGTFHPTVPALELPNPPTPSWTAATSAGPR